jgi:hypothetical protein
MTKTDYDPDRSLVPDRGSLSFYNKFSTKFTYGCKMLFLFINLLFYKFSPLSDNNNNELIEMHDYNFKV